MTGDFHIHSCLSPCADRDMTPYNIAAMAYVSGLKAFALTDHNSAANVPRARRRAKRFNLGFLPGIEVCTREDIHMLCYFPSVDSCVEFGEKIYRSLPPIKNDERIYYPRQVMDRGEGVLEIKEKFLISACPFTARQTVQMCHDMGGVAFWAHIDRESYSAVSVLGAVPAEAGTDGAELYFAHNRDKFIKSGILPPDMPCIVNSDAHSLEQMAAFTPQNQAAHPLKSLIKMP